MIGNLGVWIESAGPLILNILWPWWLRTHICWMMVAYSVCNIDIPYLYLNFKQLGREHFKPIEMNLLGQDFKEVDSEFSYQML